MSLLIKNILRIMLLPIRWLFMWAMALIIVFEEWGWEPLQRLLNRAVHGLRLHKLESWLQKLPPYAALIALGVPSLMLLPAKFLAFALIGKGYIFSGGAVFITAKIIGTAVIARIFSIVQPSLMQLTWFAHVYGAWKRWKDALLFTMRNTRAWQLSKAMKRHITVAMRTWFKA